MPYRSTRIEKHGHVAHEPIDTVTLTHDERHLRRKLLQMTNGDVVMLDLKDPVVLGHGDLLATEDGHFIAIAAAPEKLLEIKARDMQHQMELCWHLGNRHLSAQIDTDRILIERDHVIEAMLKGLGAAVKEVTEPFHPVQGAYHSHGSHDHHGH